MEVDLDNNLIQVDKILNPLDNLAIDFTKILNYQKISYVIVSGYVAIVFGRNRTSEAIDIIINPLTEKSFFDLWEKLMKKFQCINCETNQIAYPDYIKNKITLRFAYKDSFIPNIEFKIAKNAIDYWAIKNSIDLKIQNNFLKISPLELQIIYKLKLAENDNIKDLEDAIYLYEIFKEYLNLETLNHFIRELKPLDKYLKMIL